MLLVEEGGLGCEIHAGGARLEQVSEFKYLGCILVESGTDVAECRRRVSNGRKVSGTIWSLG